MHCAQDKFLHFYSWAPICHIDFLSNTISILPHSGVFVVVGNKLENVALLFSSHLSFSSKFAEKPILVVCMYCSFARRHFTSLYETGKKFAHIQDLRNCYTLFYLLQLYRSHVTMCMYNVYGPDHMIYLIIAKIISSIIR